MFNVQEKFINEVPERHQIFTMSTTSPDSSRSSAKEWLELTPMLSGRNDELLPLHHTPVRVPFCHRARRLCLLMGFTMWAAFLWACLALLNFLKNLALALLSFLKSLAFLSKWILLGLAIWMIGDEILDRYCH